MHRLFQGTPQSFANLGTDFYSFQTPTPLRTPNATSPKWLAHSKSTAQAIGLKDDWWMAQGALEICAGNEVAGHSHPLASVYSGHQFGVWAGQLGDGRAILLGETAQGLEVQLKGAGMTPYSRMADGRAVLRSSIREFLCSETMNALDIPTTRALCLVGSDAPIRREVIETAAVVTRVAPSFIRFGHFEHFAHTNQIAQLKMLADYVIGRHYPQCQNDPHPYAAFLRAVSSKTAEMVAKWQAVGFCHGVMNTDNMSILGLTIDYGPFQFLDNYIPNHICNHSDTEGRYAFNQQPKIAHWNLCCLAQALLPLIDDKEMAIDALESFKTLFPEILVQRMRRKLGLLTVRADDRSLVESTMRLLADAGVDYTIFWRRLSYCVQTMRIQPQGNTFRDSQTLRALFSNTATFDAWFLQYQKRLAYEHLHDSASTMLQTNPKYILRNYLAETAIRDAQTGDLTTLQTLLNILESPFEEHLEHDALAQTPPPWACQLEISCSS